MTRTSWLSALSCAALLAAIEGCGSSNPASKTGLAGSSGGDAAAGSVGRAGSGGGSVGGSGGGSDAGSAGASDAGSGGGSDAGSAGASDAGSGSDTSGSGGATDGGDDAPPRVGVDAGPDGGPDGGDAGLPACPANIRNGGMDCGATNRRCETTCGIDQRQMTCVCTYAGAHYAHWACDLTTCP